MLRRAACATLAGVVAIDFVIPGSQPPGLVEAWLARARKPRVPRRVNLFCSDCK
jgi:hypothetical protein